MRALQRRLQNLEEVSGLLYSPEHPRDRHRLIFGGFGAKPIPGKPGSYSMTPLDLGKSTCRRTLFPNGLLQETVYIYGGSEELNDEELERWIAKQPVHRFGIGEPPVIGYPEE